MIQQNLKLELKNKSPLS